MALQYLTTLKGATVTPSEERELESLVPSSLQWAKLVPILLTALQTLAVNSGTLHTFGEWSRRAGSVAPQERRNFIPTLHLFPLDGATNWSPGLFGLVLLVVNRFLERPLPGTLDDFLVSLRDLMSIAGQEAYVLELVAEILMFIKSSPGFWCLIPQS